MSNMSRAEAISILKKLKLDAEEYGKESDFVNQAVEAFDFAIASLEVDEAYQLEYERTTKNDLGVENDLVSSIVEEISEQVTETHEEFIFETIRPYCENVVQMKISKRDLEQALLKYYGKNDLGVDCIDRAQAQTEIEMNASRYTIAKERGGMGQVEWSDQLIEVSDAVDIIRHLPSVTPQEPRWIPVSERLPENCGMYIVTRKIYDCPDAPIFVSDESWFDGQNTWHNDNRINHERGYLSDVIAWMTLPQPYSEVEE